MKINIVIKRGAILFCLVLFSVQKIEQGGDFAVSVSKNTHC